MFSQWFLTDETRQWVIETCLSYGYNGWLVALSVIVAAFASYTAFHLVVRVAEAPSRLIRAVWLGTGAVSMGGGIWSMHFIAMLAVQLQREVRYDAILTLLSVAFAIIASLFAFQYVSMVSRRFVSLLVGGTILGAGIGAMHYTGMTAMNLGATIRYDPLVFATSVVVAATLSTVALRFLFHNWKTRGGTTQIQRVISGCVMGASIATMHYTGMAATYFVPADRPASAIAGLDGTLMAIALAGGTTLIASFALVASLVDQTLRVKQLRAQLNEQSLKAIVDYVGEGVIMIDEKGTIESFNPAAERIFGYDAPEVIGANVSLLMPAPFRDEHDAYLRRATLREPRTVGEKQGLKGRRKDGGIFDIEVSLSVMEMREQRYFIGVCSDVSARKRAEEELRQAIERAETANRAKSEFLATMSHEIRTPMNGVLGLAGLALDTDLTKEQREYIETIRSSGEGLLTILNDILDFSKMEAGKLELEIVTFDLLDVVESISPLLAAKIVEKGLELGTFVAPDAPRFVKGDPGRLRQVLLNLVGNAIKFTEKGGIVVDVSVVSEEDGVTLFRFEVKDTGIGIPEDVIGTLFNRFTQADASITRQFGGTGLGLSICKEVSALMGGQIGVESVMGEGSTFWFTARLGKSEEAERKKSRYPEELKGVRALVVDDHELNRRIFEKQLQSFGMTVALAEDGPSALAALDAAVDAGAAFDLALIDFMMPGMDGSDLAVRIRRNSRFRGTKLVLASSAGGHAEPSGATADWDAEFVKPVVQSRLSAILAELYGAVADDSNDRTADESEPGARRSGPRRRLRILLAEDNQVNQKVATLMLLQAGHTVDVVANGAEAVVAVRDLPYDVVLMDVQMPIMDGIKACQRIRNLPGETGRLPIIALTANAMSGDRESYLAAGMSDYISKPIVRERLWAALSRLCDGSDSEAEAANAVPAPDDPPRSMTEGEESSAELGELVDSLDDFVGA